MYPWDTICVGAFSDTNRTIVAMAHWYDRAKLQMKVLGVTQEDLIPIFGVTTRGAVGHYLRGRRDPSVAAMVALADRLQITLDGLLRGRAAPSQLERLTADTILSAYREAAIKFGATGMPVTSFKPQSDPEHAGLLALSIIAQLTASPSDSQTQVDVEVGRGAARTDRKRSGTVGEDRAQEVGGKGKSAPSKQRKSA